MGAAPRILALAGVAIHAHAGWVATWAFLALTLGARGLRVTVLLLLAVATQALAQAIAARAVGLRMRRITLHVFGSVAQVEGEARHPRAATLAALAGPLAVLIPAALATAVAGLTRPASPSLLYLYMDAARTWAAVGILNALPADPLDGGRALRALTWWTTGQRTTWVPAAVGTLLRALLGIASVLAVVRGAAAPGLALVGLALFLQQAAEAASAELALREALTPLRVRDAMTRSVVALPPEATVAQLVETFWTYHFTSYPVVSGGAVLGLVDLRDVASVDRERWARTRVRALMRPLRDDLVVGPADTLLAALEKASTNGLGRVAVLDGTALAGYLSAHDITAMLTRRGLSARVARRAAPGLRAI